ncbi:MAG: tellurite resistance protein TerC [Solirubrobacteraceae bacterium]|nr:tellurite resistance protein TerC [Solirubrobacteraceae bacterium]
MLPWLALGAFVLAALAVDLRAGSGGNPSMRAAILWSIVWTAIGAAFAAVLLVLDSPASASAYVTGFLVEKSLSLDNLFVFAVLFAFLGVPAAQRRRVLIYGVAGAIVLRGLFVVAGAAVLDTFHLATYVLGALLAFTAVKIARHGGEQVDPGRTLAMRVLKRVAPAASPGASALVMVAVFDVMFALDSIPAIFAITRDTFVVFAANAFSLLGMVSLFFVLEGLMERFRHLHLALAAILGWVAAKLVLVDVWHPPTALTLAVIAGALVTAALTSMRAERGERDPRPKPAVTARPATAEAD